MLIASLVLSVLLSNKAEDAVYILVMVHMWGYGIQHLCLNRTAVEHQLSAIYLQKLQTC